MEITMAPKKWLIAGIILFVLALPVFAQSDSADPTAQITQFIFQLAVIIFVARLGGMAAEAISQPSVLGELLAGIIIGPFALGAIPLPGFPSGLFPINGGESISMMLQAFANVAAIILLFSSGLQTDLDMLMKYSVAGSIVGLGGVIFSFGLGIVLGAFFTHEALFAPINLFIGIMSTATSVGITARILSDRKKMDSPEGVTILAAAVFDDVLGIILLAVVLGIVAVLEGSKSGGLSAGAIVGISAKAFGLWLSFTALGLIFSRKISTFLKKIGGEGHFNVLALGLAFFIAGIFEMQGLSMIIGAYIVGLSLSKTEISFIIQDKTKVLFELFVPIFFVVMGMQVQVSKILEPSVLIFGLVFTVVAMLAKVLGCGLPTLFLGFNKIGALRIGIGMIPRGEVALIIAGIGLSSKIVSQEYFGASILMTILTTIAAPILLNLVLDRGGRGTIKKAKATTSEEFVVDLPNSELAELLSSYLLADLQREGFYVQLMSISDDISHIRKGDVSISMKIKEKKLTLEAAPEDLSFVRMMLYETMVKLDANLDKLKETYDPSAMRRELTVNNIRKDTTFRKILDPRCIDINMRAATKEEAIEELVSLLDSVHLLKDKDKVLADVLEREKSMSTGMQNGIALPHARTSGVDKPVMAIGVHTQGIDFQTIDGTPAHIIALIASSEGDPAPHMQILASLGSTLGSDIVREQLLHAKTREGAAKILGL
jgi:Kef-type K+ transport system membrane component KefB/mannitol/fructose-specific phosphotransferase system IIA component (Ntr-type)